MTQNQPLSPYVGCYIDGGGIRGIIPALVIAHLERKAKKPASELFDLMVGTSTGGMLALGLSLEGEGGAPLFNARKMVKLMRRMVMRSLSNRCGASSGPSGVFLKRRIPMKLEGVLTQYFGARALADCGVPTMVTTTIYKTVGRCF